QELWKRLPHELSGGECQRVLLGRALACNPRALILDEPVSALDAAVRQQVLGDLLSLRDRLGLALLLIAHDLHMVRDVADRLLVMDAGRVVEEGQTASIMARPQAAATVALLSAAGLGAGAGAVGNLGCPSFVGRDDAAVGRGLAG
ncbi:MAG TPA: ATP-binding cassette domain-containing protein, partial [Thermoanaerobaculaceae bacterium]|nr:ATP-binding cassette domain-containing protein [Thermoanaerobaculaceae bacterium]